MANRRSALVIGGGVIGLTTALALKKCGLSVVLIDSGVDSNKASLGNAGHIAIEQVAPLASLDTVRSMPKRLFSRGGALALPLRDIAAWVPFALRLLNAARPARFKAGCKALGQSLEGAMAAWRRLLDQIGARELLLEDGHFVVWETKATAAQGRAAWMAANIGQATVRDATPAELEQLATIMTRPIAGAIRFNGSGQIADLNDLVSVLRAKLDEVGQRMEGTVERLTLEGDRAVAVAADGSRHTADVIVVAGGVGSGKLLEPMGHRVPIIAERGYHIQSASSDWPAGMPPVVFEDRSMIVTRFRSGLRAASFVEFSQTGSAADRRKWERLRSHVSALGLPFTMPGSEWIGSRPTLPDYLPAIGFSGRAANLFYAFGHNHLGLTLAATTAEAVAALVAGITPPFDLAPFNLDRF